VRAFYEEDVRLVGANFSLTRDYTNYFIIQSAVVSSADPVRPVRLVPATHIVEGSDALSKMGASAATGTPSVEINVDFLVDAVRRCKTIIWTPSCVGFLQGNAAIWPAKVFVDERHDAGRLRRRS
jgi:hypothetical protein